MSYQEYKGLNLPAVAEEILEFWKREEIFAKSISERSTDKPFVFFEGPPSANGMPGIHHVMARTIKDLFCRYKTLQGFRVERRAGWDTHGLPVEIGVEKELGITKEDIGSKISIEDYNKACREAVMRYTESWNRLTELMGYWVDMTDPYITYKSKYMESVWYQLRKLYDSDLLYKGYTIQPYSPAAGTGLSTHELNQPGCYREVKDTSVVAQFLIEKSSLQQLEDITGTLTGPTYFIAWTTTPWTLPSNTALAVGNKIDYVLVETFNQYTLKPINVILAADLLAKNFSGSYTLSDDPADFINQEPNPKSIPYRVIQHFRGSDLVGIRYQQLLPYHQPAQNPADAFRVISGDFVTTEDGTGVVHIAPTFGADDAKVAKEAGIPPMLVADKNGNLMPLVDLQGRFVDGMGELSGMYVKNDYYTADQMPEKSVDVLIAIDLKEQNKAFKVEKYTHSYPHCWRTDKPVLYYPLDSWFVKVTARKDRLIELNKQVNWKPASTGTGRFANWLENINDWNLSRSRYWGIPIPIWRTEDGVEECCIGSAAELKEACEKAVEAGFMQSNPLADFEPGNMSEENYDRIDLHKNFVDEIVLVSPSGKKMKRESDLIDVWFDSGSMPYAQWHYPFENADQIDNREAFPADFIAEGVDQTRGWFYTLHAIAAMNFDSVAYKTVVSNGLVLDKNGQKMSKRLGNAVDPFETLDKYGPDATRWYMVTNAQPWDNLKFDESGIVEVQRKFFGTLYNTYSFFALYANLDNFSYSEKDIDYKDRPEIDRWILSRLNTLKLEVVKSLDSYEPTRAGRLIQQFVVEELSNWYVRICRRRFWKGEMSADKLSAYQTLYTCLETVAQLSSPIAPFYMDRLFRDLNKITGRHQAQSVHLSVLSAAEEVFIDADLERKMEIAQRITSLILGLRKQEKLKVRQPLQKIMVPVTSETFRRQLNDVRELILSEVNVKELEYLEEDSDVLVKWIKPDFKRLGPKSGSRMKEIAAAVAKMGQPEIAALEKDGNFGLSLSSGDTITLQAEDVNIGTQDIPGWIVASEGDITVALDITLTADLKYEGIARELVNRIQNLRKNSGLEVTDRIGLVVEAHPELEAAITNNLKYICAETLADKLEVVAQVEQANASEIEVATDLHTRISINKL